MIPDNLIFLQVVPKDDYFIWQLDVQIHNFRKHNISHLMQILVWYPSDYTDFSKWDKLSAKYPEAKFYYYKDEGVNLSLYIPQLRPHTLKKHFHILRELLEDKVFFYHDSDIIFNYLPDFEALVEGPICWQSDCSSYLDYSYMRSKERQGNMQEHEGVDLMAQIGRVDVKTIFAYDKGTGGAQNILKGIDAEYWEDVERICLEIRNKFFFGVPGSVNKTYFPSENAGWQSWTCDMWAVNFALWSRGIPTGVTDDLAFSWGTDTVETYQKKPIFHLAGVTANMDGLFYKGKWINDSPIGKVKSANIKPTSACFFYVKELEEVEN